jgi:aryl-alcohol dehydrogenase-like predicted oxidoreductase
VCAQDHWSLLERDLEDGALPAIERHGLALLPYFPLASGLLTGKYRPDADPDPTWRLATLPAERRQRHLGQERLATVALLEAFAVDQGHTLLELAFSWLAAHAPVASVIAGATRPEQVRANAAAVAWELSADDLAEVDRLTGRG